MKSNPTIPALLALGLLAAPFASLAGDGDWKRGRIYYRMVCTSCHTEKAGGAISPTTKTKAEWQAYLQADKHAKGKDSLKYYVSTKYRDSIKATNKAAAKFSDVPDEELMNDIKAFVTKGAKDGDAPAKCS
ncbi:MAG: c-type cytochrome [Hydrogenophilaceae bacterium]